MERWKLNFFIIIFLKLAALWMMLALRVPVFPHFKIYVSMCTEVLCVCTYMCVCMTILSKSFALLTNSIPAESERKGVRSLQVRGSCGLELTAGGGMATRDSLSPTQPASLRPLRQLEFPHLLPPCLDLLFCCLFCLDIR